MAQKFGEVWDYFEQHNFKVKTAVAAFGADFGHFWAIFNSTIWSHWTVRVNDDRLSSIGEDIMKGDPYHR